jgi:hypothetical protein
MAGLGYGANSAQKKKSDQAPQRLDVTDENRRFAEIYQALTMPILQNLVDALPTASGHVAEFSLRDVKLHGRALEPVRAGSFGEVQQSFCETRLEMPKHHILDLFARLPQPLAQDSQHDHAKVRPMF